MDWDCWEGKAHIHKGLTSFALINTGLKFCDLIFLFSWGKDRPESSPSCFQFLKFVFAIPPHCLIVILPILKFSSWLDSFHKSSCFSDVVSYHFDVVIKNIILTEEKILLKSGFTKLILWNKLALSCIVMMSDQISFVFGQDLFENISYFMKLLPKSLTKWLFASLTDSACSLKLSKVFSTVFKISVSF